jgi:iron complex transport system substrate-binding protein
MSGSAAGTGPLPRIASLLPGATEIVCALDLEEALVAVSHSCDFGGRIESLPRVTRTRVPRDAPSREIDAMVRECLERGESLYQLDQPLLEALRPELIVTQSLCEVCAVGPSEVSRATPSLTSQPRILTLEPRTLEEVFSAIAALGAAVGRGVRAQSLIRDLRARVDAVRERAAALTHRPRVAFLEWADPPICGGHWNPELVELAGGRDGLGRPGERSRAVEWDEVVVWRPEVLVLACCGFDATRGWQELESLRRLPGFDHLPCARSGRLHAMDGIRLFSRPGPSLVESLERLAAVVTGPPVPPPTATAPPGRAAPRRAARADPDPGHTARGVCR